MTEPIFDDDDAISVSATRSGPFRESDFTDDGVQIVTASKDTLELRYPNGTRRKTNRRWGTIQYTRPDGSKALAGAERLTVTELK